MNFNRIYNVDFNRLVLLLTPVFWRKRKFIDFLSALIAPVINLKFDFDIFRRQSIYKVVHNGQVGLLEKVLNDAFDVEQRRIYIIDSVDVDPLYIYTNPEARPVYIGTQYVYDNSSFNDADFDFLVIVPISLKPSAPLDITNFENKMKALVNYYKLASKRYKIVYE